MHRKAKPLNFVPVNKYNLKVSSYKAKYGITTGPLTERDERGREGVA